MKKLVLLLLLSLTACDSKETPSSVAAPTISNACMLNGVDRSACATPMCSLPDTTDTAGCGWSDSTGDGLSDRWKSNGYIDMNCNGTFDAGDVSLPNVKTNQPNIYVLYDWLELPSTGESCSVDSDCQSMSPLETHQDENCVANVCTGHTHDPEALAPGAMAAVSKAFSEKGFNLQIVRGHARPHSHVVSFRTPTASCEGADVAPGTLGAYAVNFDDLKKLAFSEIPDGSQLVYHYVVFGHYSSCDTSGHCIACPVPLNSDGSTRTAPPSYGQTGISEITGQSFIVSLGRLYNDLKRTPTVIGVGGTFMHELGHNLGLHHGGGQEDTPLYKPNYISVMNYAYQIGGIQSADSIGSSTPDPALTRLDYSTQVLPVAGNTPGELEENGMLDETAGLGSGTADLFTFVDGQCNSQLAATTGAVDWDGDGIAGDNSNATADLNPSENARACGTVTTEVMRGHADWASGGQSEFTYAFQCTSFYPNGLSGGVALNRFQFHRPYRRQSPPSISGSEPSGDLTEQMIKRLEMAGATSGLSRFTRMPRVKNACTLPGKERFFTVSSGK